MTKQHTIGKIAKNSRNYKRCARCGKINWLENEHCIGCGKKDFRAMNDQYGKCLLLDWEKEPDLLLQV